MTVPADYPDRVKARRTDLGLSQTAFAERLGVSFATVNRWENGRTTPSEESWALVVATADAPPPETPAPADPDPEVDFGADPAAVRAVVEGERLAAGYTASPAFATEVSRIDPLPHQRIAVYERMLTEPRLRLLLADDPGAGKTIMTGLYVREMLARRLIRRVLVVPPAGLVGNWQSELDRLFELDARIVTGPDIKDGNPFVGPGSDLVVCSVDTLRRPPSVRRLRHAEPYDLVVFDEAHKLAVHQAADGRPVPTERYKLAEALAGVPLRDEAWALPWAARHLLLLTATPHMGKDYPYYGLWRLLDPDVFPTEDAFRNHPAPSKARYFLRRTKEEMVHLDGTPVYPPRHAVTLPFELSGPERDLYDRTTAYMRRQYNRAKILNRSAAQLAMSVFQRRLASSTYALARSLRRRADKLDGLIAQVRSGTLSEDDLRRMQAEFRRASDNDPFETMTADEEGTVDGLERHEQTEREAEGWVIATTLQDLETERAEVLGLVDAADRALDPSRGTDTKFERLREELDGAADSGEKLLVFTEHKDTLDYLVGQLEAIGYGGRIAQIHGGLAYPERDRQADRFRRPNARGGAAVLVGTDAAGEGINLQVCWRMVNYDIPWNPARLEQRMGRIHRYGQRHERVAILNLVAEDTREGRVLKALIDKLEAIREAFRDQALPDGKVFDVVGRVLQGVSIRDYMTGLLTGDTDEDAVLADIGRRTTRENALQAVAEGRGEQFDTAGEVARRLPALRAEVERERLRQLLPGYVLRYLREALPLLGIEAPPESGAPFALRAVRPGALDPLLPALEGYPDGARSVCTVHRPGADEPLAVWLRPGEALFDAVCALVRVRFGDDALRGGVFVDPTARDPYVLHVGEVSVEHAADDGSATVLEHRTVALRLDEAGAAQEAALEGLLLLQPAEAVPVAHRHLLRRGGLSAARAERELEAVAEERTARHRQARERTAEERERHLRVGFDLQAAQLAARRSKLRRKKGTKTKDIDGVRERQRLLRVHRETALDALRQDAARVRPGPSALLANVLVLPTADPDLRRLFDADVEARAMREAVEYERALGARVYDVSTPGRAQALGLDDWPGFDVLSRRPDGAELAIEVKGRAGGGGLFLTGNEWAKACNLGDRYWLYGVYHCATAAPVLVRVQDPFARLVGRVRTGYFFDEHDIRAVAERD